MAKTPIKPLADYIVASQEEAQTKTASGLFLPEKNAEKPKIAKVLEIGSGVADVKIGDRVIYGGYSNTEIKINGVDYLLIKLENVYAVLA